MSNRCLDVTALWYNILSSLGVNYPALTGRPKITSLKINLYY